MRKKVKKWISLALCATMVLAMSFMSDQKAVAEHSEGAFVPTISATPSKDTVNLLDGDIYEFAYKYKKGKSANYLPKGYGKDNSYREDDFAPKSMTLSWQSEEDVQYYTVKLSRNADLSDAVSYVTLNTFMELTDLYAGYDYYYQIVAKFAEKTVKSQIFKFHTENLIRTISLEGVPNTRDAGGYYTVDGSKRVRQGMIYRGGKLDDITAAGKEKALKVYGFKTDLDMRADIMASPLGGSVNFVNVSGPYYIDMSNGITISDGNGITSTKESSRGPWTGTYKDALIKEIKTFANPDNYPIYAHCSLGRDRTGTLIFLINALCGVGEIDLYMDYEATFFSTIGCKDGNGPEYFIDGPFGKLVNYLKNYDHGTLAENVEAFMLHYLGIEQSEIDSIRSILLEEVAEV